MSADDLARLKIDKTPHGMHRRPGKALVGAVLLIIAAVAVIAGMFRRPLSVQTAMVSTTYPSQNLTVLNASGYVVAQRKASVSAKVTSRLEWLGVSEGNRISAGQVIARLESEDVHAALDQARANLSSARGGLEQARAELEDATLAFTRVRDLVGNGVLSRAEFDSAEARLKKARAGVKSSESIVTAMAAAVRGAENAVEYTVIRAPFNGVVLTKNADVGDIVTPLGAAANAKAAVVTIADLSSLQVEADVSEGSLMKIKVGQPCEIQLDALPGKRLPGRVATIVPTADRSKATVLVKVAFLEKDPAVLPEMSAKVAFLDRPVPAGESHPITTVPTGAVKNLPGGASVYVVRDSVAVQTSVRLGRKLSDQVEVVSGVKPGDRVVLSPVEKLKNGLRVTLAEK